MTTTKWLGWTLACAAVVLTGCGGSDSNDGGNGSTSGSFYGTYADQSGAGGTISLTGTSPLTSVTALGGNPGTPLTGELLIRGQAAIPLAGTFDSTTGILGFADAAQSYAFSGTADTARAVGTGTVPAGAAVFVLFRGGTAGSVDTYCGTAVCTAPAGCNVAVDLTLSVEGSTALLTVSVNGTVFIGVGSATASTVDFHITQGGVDVTIHGNVTGNTVTGTWSDNASGSSGTWNAGSCSM